MNLSMTDHHKGVMKDALDSGEYKNAAEVMREAMRLFEQSFAERQAKKRILERMIDASIEDIASGRVYEAEDVFERLNRKLDEAHHAKHM